MVGYCLNIVHDHFLPNPSQVIIHKSSYYSILHNPGS
jgi:hypothetical protein